MNILGINGLGLNPAACLLKDGELFAFAEEERFSRIKESYGVMPVQATAYCLHQAGIRPQDLDGIAFGWNARLYPFYMSYFYLRQFFKRGRNGNARSGISRVSEELYKYSPANVKSRIKEMLHALGYRGILPNVHFYSHHLSHAASTFYHAGLSDAIILVMDGSGECHSTSIYHGNSAGLELMKNFEIPDSLGWFFQGITEYLGFKPNSHEGKVMALAAYGTYNSEINKLLHSVLKVSEEGLYHHDGQYSYMGKHSEGMVFSDQLTELLGPSRRAGEAITSRHHNIAFAAQNILEEASKSLILKYSLNFNKPRHICLAGGVSLNCKMNGVLREMSEVASLYAPPFCSDAGTALGAAMLLSFDKGVAYKANDQPVFLGPEFNDEAIHEYLMASDIIFEKVGDPAFTAAQLLYEGNIIAWFQGRMEIGPRALGARSILADPRSATTRDFINQEIKHREIWRPFAASMLEEYAPDYLVNSQKSPFMTIAFQATQLFISKAPAAIHIDHTTRPQTVSRSDHPLYWRLINKFGELSGVYAVLNTSFNLNEEPVVCSPEDALRTFQHSPIDHLVIGSYLVSKR
jgi:carbamoyltransferase